MVPRKQQSVPHLLSRNTQMARMSCVSKPSKHHQQLSLINKMLHFLLVPLRRPLPSLIALHRSTVFHFTFSSFTELTADCSWTNTALCFHYPFFVPTICGRNAFRGTRHFPSLSSFPPVLQVLVSTYERRSLFPSHLTSPSLPVLFHIQFFFLEHGWQELYIVFQMRSS